MADSAARQQASSYRKQPVCGKQPLAASTELFFLKNLGDVRPRPSSPSQSIRCRLNKKTFSFSHHKSFPSRAKRVTMSAIGNPGGSQWMPVPGQNSGLEFSQLIGPDLTKYPWGGWPTPIVAI